MDKYNFFIDLNESLREHTIQIAAWDSDAWEDDMIDISPDGDWNSLIFNFDSVSMTEIASYTADGTPPDWLGRSFRLYIRAV